VVIGETDPSGRIEILWGVRAGDQVVTRGAFLLNSEIQKERLGAACCE
jgi:cobalt-zinc-cadmium efflux system membrane fusion protein